MVLHSTLQYCNYFMLHFAKLVFVYSVEQGICVSLEYGFCNYIWNSRGYAAKHALHVTLSDSTQLGDNWGYLWY